MSCQCCSDFREWPGTVAARRHSEGCLYCGARAIWRIQRMQIARSIAADRCRGVLAAWMKKGFAEAELRRLAKLPEPPLAPELEPAQRGKNG
jgi:hypothetical protein